MYRHKSMPPHPLQDVLCSFSLLCTQKNPIITRAMDEENNGTSNER